MTQRDEAIKYNSLYQEVELAISNIKNLGFDVSDFEKKLKEIHNEVNNNVKVNYVKGMAEASYIQSYTKGIGELNKLKIKLDNYDVYASAYNTCNYINMLLESNVSQREIEKCISKIIAVLKSINKSRTIDYDSEKHIVEKIYETAYNVIKLEVTMTGQSQLYLFIKNEDANVSYFNNLVIRDIEAIDLQDDKNRDIKTKMYELGQRGIYSNYLDLGLIKLIIANSDVDLKEKINSNIKQLCDEIEANVKSILNIQTDISEKSEDARVFKNKLIMYTSGVKKRIVSLILTVSLVIFGGTQVPKLAKRVSDNNGYIKQTEILSSTGIEYSEVDKAVKYDEPKDSEVVVKVMPIITEPDAYYQYKEYDASDVKLDSIKEYYDYAVEHYDIDLEHNSLEIQKTNYIKSLSVPSTVFSLYLIYILLLLVLELLSMLPINIEDISWTHYISIKRIKGLINSAKGANEDLIRVNKELKELVDLAMEEINRDERLRSRFNALYEENKFLLDDPEELFNRINNLKEINKIAEVKRLVREKK